MNMIGIGAKKPNSIVLLPVFIFCLITNGWGRSNDSSVKVIESSDDKIVFEINPFELRFVERSVNGQTFEIPQIDGYQSMIEPGKPQLPFAAVLVGIPPNSSPTIQILDYRSSLVNGKIIYPAPQVVVNRDGKDSHLAEQFYLDQQSYSQNRFYPGQHVLITSIGTLRQQRVARVELYPLQYNPVAQQLQKVEQLKFAILFNQTSIAAEKSMAAIRLVSDTPYESLYQNLLINYATARKWRISNFLPDQVIPMLTKSTSWYNPHSTFYKLYVDDPGIYRLNGDFLITNGIDLNSFDPQRLKIYNKGIEIPIFISGEQDGRFDREDYIEFYGEPNRGQNTFYDPYTNTNVYWLTWSNDYGLRTTSKPAEIGATSEILEYIEQVHLEQENLYHEGDNNIALINSELVNGEGWVWRFFYPGDRENISIQTPNVSGQGAFSRLKIKLHGTTIDLVRPNHHVRVLLNNKLIGDFFFNGTEDYLFEATLDSIEEGENRLELVSVGDTGAQIDQFYLDWIELNYPRQFVAKNDAIEFVVSDVQNQLKKITLWGFTDPDINIFDLTDHTIISNPFIAAGKRLICKVVSAGFDDGMMAQFQINSETIGGSWHRGHNLVVLDEVTGLVLDSRHYDTHFSASESDSMASFIQRLPFGRIVLVAIMDEGSQNLTPSAYLALESLGSQFIRKVGFRDSWALIGRKGAMVGTVPEVFRVRGSGVAILQDTIFVSGSGSDFYTSFDVSLNSPHKFMAASRKGVKFPSRVEFDQPTDLTSPQHGADLIIISHRKFFLSAQRLAEYRAQHNGLRVKVVDVEDIYDEFNFGLIDPQAIKDFLKFAYTNWQAPAPSYVILFGDASWDFKKNSGPTANENYVPSYGNPASDNWYVCLDGIDDVLPDMFIGRIPVSSDDEAEGMLEKIIVYENTPSALWKKNLLFITGGFNKSEQRIFTDQSKFLINTYVTPPPASCRAFQINKTTEGYFEGEKKLEILEAMNRGMMWVNFIGHAGSRTWDLMFNHPDIEELTNKDKYPFITSMTCHTGRFAEPDGASFAEHFVLTEDKGAIAFWGTTGWGFVFQDNILLKNLFQAALVDTIHALGAATTIAKIKLWQNYGGGIYNTSVIHQYTLIGDPLTNLTLPEKPDLTIHESDISLTPATPAEADSAVAIKIKIQNWGLATNDSVSLSVYDLRDNELKPIVSSMRCPAVGFEDSLVVIWDLKDQAGEHVLRFILDPENHIDEFDEQNNQCDLPIYVYSSKLTVSRPINFQIVSSQQVALQVNNPAFASSHESHRYYEFEVDTCNQFNSSVLISSPKIAEGKIVTQWRTPALADKRTYFWRCRTIDGMDFGNWVIASFYTQRDSSFAIWQHQHPQQFSQNDFENSQISDGGVRLQQRRFHFEVVSAGFEDGNYLRIIVNSTAMIQASRGHNLVVIDQGSGQVLYIKTFDTLASQDHANAMADLINGLEPGTYVLIGIMDEGTLNMTERAYLALESLGSQYCRQVKFRDSWAMIGIKGAPIGSVAEAHVPATKGIATVRDTLVNYHQRGSIVSVPIGPADGWNSLSWEQIIEASSSAITLDVIGFNQKLSQWDTLLVGLSNYNHENLNAIDSRTYPLIKLRANLLDATGLNTPILQSWKIDYAPVSDPAINYQVVNFSADTLMEGETLKLSLSVYNVGMKVVDSVRIRFSLQTPENGRVNLGHDHIIVNIPIDSFRVIEQQWETSGWMGKAQFMIEIDPDKELNELSEANNFYAKPIYVLPDSSKPEIVVTYDGKRLVSGDYVASQPMILVNIYDNARLIGQNDTTRINLFLDNQRVSYAGNEQVVTIVPIYQSSEPRLRAQVRFTPSLADGKHRLEVFVKDARNNLSYHRDDFLVTSEFKLLNVVNYPNPFRDETEFTFRLTQPAEKVTIKIFTVAGRLIRTLEFYYLEPGFQHLYWDGRDQDQNELANGVYFYKVVARSGEHQAEQIEKLVIMR